MAAPRAGVLAGLLLAAACGTAAPPAGPPTQRLPARADGLSLDPVPAPPAPAAGDPYPATCTLDAAHDDTAGYDRVDATCWVHAGVPAVWHALADPSVTADPTTIDLHAHPVPDHDPRHILHLLVTYDAKDFLTVTYAIDWTHTLLAGTAAAPAHVLVTFHKVAGTSFITLLEGTYELSSPAPGVTELVMCSHVNVADTGIDDLEQAALRTFHHLAAAAGASVAGD